MAKIAQCFTDNAGQLHSSAEAAAVSDIAAALGRLSADSGISGGVAKLILDKRAEIEAAFRDLDRMNELAPPPPRVATREGVTA